MDDFFDLGFAQLLKPRDFHGLYILLFISSAKLEIVKVLHKTRIWDKQEAS